MSAMIFRSRRGSVVEDATVDRGTVLAEADRIAASGDLRGAIEHLTVANREARSPDVEFELRRLRNLAGVAMLENAAPEPRYAEPSEPPAVDPVTLVPEVEREELDPGVLRAAILRSGCLLVRGLFDLDRAKELAAAIERAYEVREKVGVGGSDPAGYYDELEPEGEFEMGNREWIAQGGGLLAADSPRLLFELLEGFEAAGLRELVSTYLGEAPAISAQKCTLRKAEPTVAGAWHQDGAFMGDVRSLNVWISLSRCGDVAPGMDIVPRRLEEFVETGTEGTWFDSQVSQEVAERAAADVGIVRPIFDPGDALLFDDLFLHQTGSDAEMVETRLAIESWFFGVSSYPSEYVPLAL